jgi:hypothetical protein
MGLRETGVAVLGDAKYKDLIGWWSRSRGGAIAGGDMLTRLGSLIFCARNQAGYCYRRELNSLQLPWVL